MVALLAAMSSRGGGGVRGTMRGNHQKEEEEGEEHVGTAAGNEGIKCDIRRPRELERRVNGLRERLARRGAAAILGDSAVGQVVSTGTVNFLNIYNTVLVVRLVCTWFPNAPPSLVQPLSSVTDPYLNLFRGIIPPLGGTLDLSPIIAFTVLNVFTSSAAALPCESPEQHQRRRRTRSPKTRVLQSALLNARRHIGARYMHSSKKRIVDDTEK